MNFVITVELIPLVNEALAKKRLKNQWFGRVYLQIEWLTCLYRRLVSSDHTPYSWNNVRSLKSHTTLYDITVILLKVILIPDAQCPNRDEVSDRILDVFHSGHRFLIID